MLDSQGFDLWADDYDRDVGLSDESDRYPFAGYREILNDIYNRILSRRGDEAPRVLDLGFGTGTLTTRLYGRGCRIWGQDFSPHMIARAREKMPEAELYQGDLSKGLVDALSAQKYDAIVATYSLHHLTDGQKANFLRELLPLLNPGGSIYIGDVAFATQEELERCREKAGTDWDDDEIYFVVDRLKEQFPWLTFTRHSDCAGLIELTQIDGSAAPPPQN
ncbi:class I SAM-dependent methyltransferase [Pseudoflavonifractor sp. CLA-AP-H29]|uniref:Class I SAM-dependent methyltransferase n=1 Tax=Pseudoflavonifractor intestinihominis TaxID=3133171 RepID=A0ABV1E7E4_9FIRM